MRFRQAIEEKRNRHRTYVADGWLSPTDPFVIAIGGAGIMAARKEATLPRIIRSVLPFGPEQVHFDRDTLNVVGYSYAHQAHVTKLSGAVVSTDLFQNPEYSDISGLLYAWVDELNHPPQLGATSVFIHNPLATNPVPQGLFRFGLEYWVADDNLWVRSYES